MAQRSRLFLNLIGRFIRSKEGRVSVPTSRYTDLLMDVYVDGDIPTDILKVSQYYKSQLAEIDGQLSFSRSEAEVLAAQLTAKTKNHSLTDPRSDEMLSIASTAVARLLAVTQERNDGTRFLRAFQHQHRIERPPIVREDPLRSASILALLASLEGIATGIFLAGNGFTADVTSGLLKGLMISSVNVSLSAFAGFVFGRSWDFGKRARTSTPPMRRRRRLARLGIFAWLVTTGVMHYLTAVVRATGEFEAVTQYFLDFQTVFDSYESWLLISLGIVFSGASFLKGVHSFADPYHQYSEIYAAAMERPMVKAAEIARTAREDIDELFDDISDDNEGMLIEWNDEELEMQEVLNEAAELESNFDALRQEAQDALRAELSELSDDIRSILRREFTTDAIDIDKLLDIAPKAWTPPDVPQPGAAAAWATSRRAELERAYQDARARVETAYTKFNSSEEKSDDKE
ncbi:hypothetical protein [Parvularcula marina]|uniref:Uncharacterized protein n=1 Tax=Parvularcula marina TaxID=2292771 RepID=A0A371RL85_9PROT|nr:hypothetical protein [Parvularcula marina]RFB06214.1 hypothetical protein DX908_13630 [Parvularcula marina]